MDLTLAVDIYCERTGPQFWAEPVNALTNLAFPVAALWGAWAARARGVTAPVVWLLIVMAAGIGLGSFLFHTYATVWSGLADTIPIWTFVALFVFVAIHRIGGVAPRRIVAIALAVAAVLVVVFLAAGDGSVPDPNAPPPVPSRLNGSEQYAPALAALLVFSGVMGRQRHPLRHWVWAATATFLVSLTFRTLDKAVCAAFPLGTHFGWHLLNGLMIGLLLQMLVRTEPAAPRAVR